MSTTIGGVAARDGAELGDGHLVGRQHLQQERLELVVGAVDLVDEQHRRRLAQRAEHRPGEQEPLVEERLLRRVGVGDRSAAGGLEGAQVQDLPREVPVVERLGRVDALVALQPDQRQVQRLGEGLGQGGLAGARLALQQQGPLHGEREVPDRGERVVAEVAGLAEALGQVVGRAEGGRLHGTSIHHGTTAVTAPFG